jgi:membrane protease YdiL (CAAX protease family)
MAQTATIGILAVLIMLGVGASVWVFAPAFQGAEAARRDLGSHRLEFGAWLSALVLIGIVAVPLALIFHIGNELTPTTFALSAIATDVPLLLVIYVRLIMPGAMTWSELGLKPLPLGYVLTVGLGAGLAGLVVIDLVLGTVLTQFGLKPPNQLEQFQSVLNEGPLGLVLFLVAAAVVAPFVEELFFRGFLFGVYRRRQPLWLAYLVSSLLFAVLHLNNRMSVTEGIALSIGIFLLALILAAVYRYTDSLYPGMLAHAVNNTAAILLFYSLGAR